MLEEKSKYFKKYIEPNKKYLLKYAKEIGIYCKSEDMLLAEAFSRKLGEDVLWDINEAVELIQQKQSERFDIKLLSGLPVCVEVKCRGCALSSYPTTDITAKKGDFILGKEGWLIVVLLEGYDYLVFDLTKDCFTEGVWTHKEKSAEPTSEMITERKCCFDPAKAIYKGKLKNKDVKWITRIEEYQS